MGQRVLFFEEDAQFAEAVRAALRARGVEVEVTSDGNEGVDRAASLKPDLILLTIENSSVNGYLVCKKLRKLPETASTPMIILSSKATESDFEQHRRLRTRAEDYVHKPIAPEALIVHVGALIPLPPPRQDEDVPFDSPNTDLHALAKEEPASDQEIDAFADSAFDALMVEEEEEPTSIGQLPEGIEPAPSASAAPAPPTPPAAPPIPAAPAAAPEPASSSADAFLRERLHDLEAALDEAERSASEGRDRVKALEARVAEADERAKAAEAREAASKASDDAGKRASDEALAQIERLERELSEAKRSSTTASVAPPRPAAGSGREILDLQAQINRKDKEALDLKDQLSAKEKQLLELRDRNLELERDRADANDRQLELERQLVDLREAGQTLALDKETIGKRADDLKARLERTEARLKSVEEDLEAERALRAADVARLTEDHTAATAELVAKQAATLETAAREASEAREALREDHARAVAKLEAEHAEQARASAAAHEEAIASRGAEHDARIAALREELEAARESALEAARAASDRALAEAEERREREAASASAAHASAVATLREELEGAAKAAREELERRHGTDLAALGRKLAEAENTLTTRQEAIDRMTSELEAARREASANQEQLEGTSAELASTRASLESTTSELESARATVASLEARSAELAAERALLNDALSRTREKIAGDEALLERARRAVSIGLSLLEDQKANGVPDAE